MPDYTQIRYEVSDSIATVTLARPEKLNAFTGVMMHELLDVFDVIDADDAVRVVIVTGEGKGFCAGADLSSGAKTFDDGDWSSTSDDRIRRDGGGQVTLRIFACKKPVIAAINGAAVGIGATMTLPMDVRLASSAARIGFVFTRREIGRAHV
jgi:enoyl-CoA hydratase/carnithine racemase